MKPETVICDTDFIISLLFKEQSTHAQAVAMYELIKDADTALLEIILFEVVTVISRKYSQKDAIKVGQLLRDELNLSFIELSSVDVDNIWLEFKRHKKKGISFFDCANLVMAKKQDAKIASFDQFYPKNRRLLVT